MKVKLHKRVTHLPPGVGVALVDDGGADCVEQGEGDSGEDGVPHADGEEGVDEVDKEDTPPDALRCRRCVGDGARHQHHDPQQSQRRVTHDKQVDLVEGRVHEDTLHGDEGNHDDTEHEALDERGGATAVVEPDEDGARDEDEEDEDDRVGLVEFEEVALVQPLQVDVLEALGTEDFADSTT